MSGAALGHHGGVGGADLEPWRVAWHGARRGAYIGNVAEYNGQFLDPSLDERQRLEWYREGHHYACLAPFYGCHPGVVVLPHHLDQAWIEAAGRQLEWDRVELYSGIASGGSVCDAILARPALLGRLREGGGPVVPWGETPQFRRALAPGAGAAQRYESKAEAHALFERLAVEHPGIAVPVQERVASWRRAVRVVSARAAAGGASVLKTEFGVGGYGTTVVTPADVAGGRRARGVLRRLVADGDALLGGSLLVEEFVEGSGGLRDLSFDGVVGADGGVYPVGVAVMRVEGTNYRGATVGPGVVPEELEGVAVGFGRAVGLALAEDGYRGWFDVDFVRGRDGRLAPTEVNLRLTGPAVGFLIRSRLAEVRGGTVVVRTLDRLPLGARLPEHVLFEHVERVGGECGAVLIATIPTAGFEAEPYVGVALAAESSAVLDAAERHVRRANAALGAMFG